MLACLATLPGVTRGDERPLPPDLAAVAREFSRVEGWQGHFEVEDLGSSSGNARGAIRIHSAVTEQRTHGRFTLERAPDESWDPGRGMFEWRGSGELFTANFLSHATWHLDGRGSQHEDRNAGPARFRDAELSIWLRERNVTFRFSDHYGGPTTTRTGYSVIQDPKVTNGKIALIRVPIPEFPPDALGHGILLPHFEEKKSARTFGPIDLFPRFAGGPGVFNLTYARPGPQAPNGMVEGRETRMRGRVLLIPVYQDLEVEVTIPGYPSWLPKGSIPDPTRPGAHLVARATLKRKTGGTAKLPAVARFEFELVDTSREPGICMNWPFAAEDEDFDLRLAAKGGGVLSEKDQKLVFEGPPADEQGRPHAEVQIDSFDFGARAELQVKCILEDGRELAGLMKGESDRAELIRLPKREGPDWVATAWRKENEVEAQAASEDQEKVAGNDFVGDGYTLYEEYRGFVLNGKHWRGDPRRRDLIVWNLLGADGRGGIALLGRAAKLRVLVRDGDSERAGGPPFEDRSSLPQEERLMNGNHRDGPHHVDQHGVFLWDRSIHRGGGSVMTEPEYMEDLGLPRNTWWAAVEPRNCPNSIFSADYGAWFRLAPRDAELAYDRAVAHELLHAIGVKHHGYARSWKFSFYFQAAGDPWNPTRTARFTEQYAPDASDFPAGKSIPASAFAGADTNVTLLWEDTLEDLASESQRVVDRSVAGVRANRAGWTYEARGGKDSAWWREADAHAVVQYDLDRVERLGYDQGTESGAELCIMRYYFASVYRIPDRAKAFYVIRPGTNRAGRELCHSPAGTHGNAPEHAPKPRFGDAFAGNGNCFAQVCMNDSYPDRKER